MKKTLSIIVAAHNEGLIAHKTMQSLERATNELSNNNISYEVIVTIDNGDEETHQYFKSHDRPNTTVHQVNFGDLAASRNYGVSLSTGQYIATLDADDLISKNWLIDSLKLLQSTEEKMILHTNFSINFGTQDIIWEKFNSRTKEEDAVIMTWANRWDSAVMAQREIFIEHPYAPNTEGFGSEDWHFNSETLAANIPHKVTPETILFVRRKDVSEMTIQAADRRTVHYTDLLNLETIKTIDTSRFISTEPIAQPIKYSLKNHITTFAKRSARYAHSKAKVNKVYLQSTAKIRSAIKQRYTEVSLVDQRLPSWLLKEWREIHLIEKAIFPDANLINTIPVYHSEMYDLGIIFVEIAKSLSKSPDYIVFVPHLTRGGAELVAIRYINTLKKQHPGWNIAVVATEVGDNPWIDRLPEEVDFIAFGELTKHLSEDLRLLLLARFIVQSQATHLHIAQSPLMFRFAALYTKLLKPLTVYAFAFCEDKDNQGRIAGHVHSGLPYAYQSIDKIFTDCTAITTALKKEYGYTGDKFHTHYQPVEVKQSQTKNAKDNTLRVLWASRVAKQKRPDILVEIGKKLKNKSIHIDVYGSFQDGYTQDIFNGIEGISYLRTFNGIEDIPTDEYDVFIYTSENDGMPNIVLEAAAKGMVVVAPNVGGISEFINKNTGILIDDNENSDAYVTALTELLISTEKRTHLSSNAQALLKTQHSTNNFEKIVSKDIT